MRVGFNPRKHDSDVARAAATTVATVTYIPQLEGYWRESLDVLRVCLDSIRAHSGDDVDIMVFDNGSCEEVRDELEQRLAAGKLQYVVFSHENLGKIGALNMLFGAVQSEYVAFTDSDVYFYPGWLEAERRVLDAFDDVGMVSGVPTPQNFGQFTESTMRKAAADPTIAVEQGALVPETSIRRYAASIGRSDTDSFMDKYGRGNHTRLVRNGVSAFATATHFQFLARSSVLKSVFPLPVSAAVGVEWAMDQKLDETGFMRLSVDGYVVHHLGNVLSDEWRGGAEALAATATRSSVQRSFVSRATRRMLKSRAVQRVARTINQHSFKVMAVR